MSTTIAVTVAPNALMPAIPGGGAWGAERFWPTGTTEVELSDDEFTALETVMAQQIETYRGMTVPATNYPTISSLPPPSSGSGWPAGCTGQPGPHGWPPLPDGELPRDRTTIGQAAYRALLACPLPISVAVLP
jgi:hypothetical protein